MRMWKLGTIAVILLIPVLGYGQTSNPFELKWRKGKSAEPAPVYEEPAATPPAPDSVVNSDTAVSEELLPEDEGEEEVVPVIESPPIKSAEDITLEDLLESVHINTPAMPKRASNAVLLLLIGLSLIIIAWIINTSRGFLRKVYRAALNSNYSALLIRENKFSSTQYLYYIVYISFLINAGVFLYLLTRESKLLPHHNALPLFTSILFVSL